MPDTNPSQFRFPACKEIPLLVSQAYKLTDFACARAGNDRQNMVSEKIVYSMVGYARALQNYRSLRNNAPLTLTQFGLTGIVRNHPVCPDAEHHVLHVMQYPVKANFRAFSSLSHAVLDLAINLTEDHLADEIGYYQKYSTNHVDLLEIGRESIHGIEAGLEYLTASENRLRTCDPDMEKQARLVELLIDFAETSRQAQLPLDQMTQILLERSNRIADLQNVEQPTRQAYSLFGLS